MKQKVARVKRKLDRLIAKMTIQEGLVIRPVFFYQGLKELEMAQGHYEFFVATEQEREIALQSLAKTQI